MYNPFSLSGKTVLITGASSGIGRSVAIECSRMGARVIVTGRDETRIEETIDSLEGDNHLSFPLDLSNQERIKELVAFIPNIDGLVSNAGINKIAPISFIKEVDLEGIMRVNAIAPILLLKELAKRKKLNSGASVVFTSSMSGIGTVATGLGAYAASKGALSSFIKVAALELAPKKIRVNAVCPGMIQTKMIHDDSIQEEDLRRDVANYPLGRYGRPQDVAWMMVYLLSDASTWVTGNNIVIDGGLTIK